MYGNSSASINMLEKGFLLDNNKDLKEFTLNEINLKVINSKYLFRIQNENIKIFI